MAHGLTCSRAGRIFLDEGSNQYHLHWQADSYPLRHQGSPLICTFKGNCDHVWEQEKLGKATYKEGAGVQGRNDSGLDQ